MKILVAVNAILLEKLERLGESLLASRPVAFFARNGGVFTLERK